MTVQLAQTYSLVSQSWSPICQTVMTENVDIKSSVVAVQTVMPFDEIGGIESDNRV